MAAYVNVHAGVGKPLWEITVEEYTVWFKVCSISGASDDLQKPGSKGTKAVSTAILTEFLGHCRIRLALPSNDRRNPYLHSALLPPHLRDSWGAPAFELELGN